MAARTSTQTPRPLPWEQLKRDVERLVTQMQDASADPRHRSWAEPLLPFLLELQQLVLEKRPDLARIRDFKIRLLNHISENRIKGGGLDHYVERLENLVAEPPAEGQNVRGTNFFG